MTTRLERGLQILSLLESEGSYNAHQLASKMGVTRRTIFRDIALLRQLGWPVEFDADSSSYLLGPAEARPSGAPDPVRPREYPAAAEPPKVGEEGVPWDATVEAVARAVRRGQPLALRRTPPRDGGDSLVLRPMELIFSSIGWSVKGRDLTTPSNEPRVVSVTLAEYRWVAPAEERQPESPSRGAAENEPAGNEPAGNEPAGNEPAENQSEEKGGPRPPHAAATAAAASASGRSAGRRNASPEGSG